MAKEFLRQFKNSSRTINLPYIQDSILGKVTVDNNEGTSGYRYWISPPTRLDNPDSLRTLIPIQFWKQPYLIMLIDKVPLPLRFYNRDSGLHNTINDREYTLAKIYFHQEALFKQPFSITNITASYENTGFPAVNIHNDNPSDYYINDSTVEQTITIETTEVDALKYLTVYTEYDGTYTYQDIVRIEVSPDGITWTTLTFSSVFDYSVSVLNITKRLKVYGNFNSYPIDTKFIRIAVAPNTKINKIALHRDNSNLLFNDKAYFRLGTSEQDLFPCSSTSYMDKYTIIPYPVPKNKSYNPQTDTVVLDETVDISTIPTDARIILPQMRFKFRKRQVKFDIDKLGIVSDGLNATRNAIFYPARKIEYSLNKHWDYSRVIYDIKEVLIPNQGNINTNALAFAYVSFNGQGSSDRNTGYWKTGLVRTRHVSYYFEEYYTLQTGGNESFTNGIRTDLYAGLVADANLQPVNWNFRTFNYINGEMFYPGDNATLDIGDIAMYNNIENIPLLTNTTEHKSRSFSTIYFKDLQTVSRQSVESEFVVLENGEIPYELVLEYPENELKVMISIDGTNWYGIDRTNNTIQTYTNIDETILATNGFYVNELNRLLPNLNLLDPNYTNQFKLYFYLPYATSEYKSIHIWLRTLYGHYIKQLYSFDNGTTWNRFNPKTQAFESITFTDNNDAYNQATLVGNLPVDKFPTGTTNVLIRYLIKSNYDFDLPDILTYTRYLTNQPKRLIRKGFEGNEYIRIEDMFNIVNRWHTGFYYLHRDNVYTITQDHYSKKPNRYKLYLIRGGYYTSSNLNTVMGKDIGINDGETIEYLIYMEKRDGAKPFKVKLLGIEILETGAGQGSNFVPFDTTKDLRQLKYIRFSRTGTNVDITITWWDNTTYSLQLQNYIQNVDIVEFNFYNNNQNYLIEILSDRTVFETEYDIVNEVPIEIPMIYNEGYLINSWAYTADWFREVFKTMKFIISTDGINWYGYDKTTGQPVSITNPNSYDEIVSKGITEIDYLKYGIDNWKTLLNIPATATEQLVKIRNIKMPLSFIPFGYFKHTLNEYYGIAVNIYHTIALKKITI